MIKLLIDSHCPNQDKFLHVLVLGMSPDCIPDDESIQFYAISNFTVRQEKGMTTFQYFCYSD